MISSELCAKCGGKCCTAPFFTLREYSNMYRVVGDARVMAHHPKLIVGGWKFTDGCPALTDTGCMLAYEDRPELCRTYPFIRIPTADGDRMILLAVKTCPYWKEFGERYHEIVEEIG